MAPARAQNQAIWHPALQTTWQWQLSGSPDLSFDVQMYDLDLFDTSASIVAALHTQGRRAICYMSAGSWENWRPDAASYPPAVTGRSNGWAGERWVDIRNLAVLGPILQARLDLCRVKGFDGVEPDNVDGYANNTGFPLTASDQIRFNRFLADEAHVRGLSVGLKNDVDQITDLAPFFDWALNEECFRYRECHKLTPFIKAGKAVFQVEYGSQQHAYCGAAAEMGFNSIEKRLSVDAARSPCSP